MAVRHVSIPRHVPARRPGEWAPVTVRRGDTALEKLLLPRAVPLAVHHLVTREPEGTRAVLAGCVVAESSVARWVAALVGGGGGGGIVVGVEV